VVYTRTVEDRELNFGVSGKLYKDALVMFDRETNSLWTQVDGSVLRGEMEGRQLDKVPALQTTWKQWKKLHPDTLVLKKARREKAERESVYADYHANPGMMGINDAQNPDSRLPGKSLVVTVRDGTDALAVPVQKLEKKPSQQRDRARLRPPGGRPYAQLPVGAPPWRDPPQRCRDGHALVRADRESGQGRAGRQGAEGGPAHGQLLVCLGGLQSPHSGRRALVARGWSSGEVGRHFTCRLFRGA
jgi:hypothetical protein